MADRKPLAEMTDRELVSLQARVISALVKRYLGTNTPYVDAWLSPNELDFAVSIGAAWDDKDGAKRYSTEINASELAFVGGGKREDRESQQPTTRGGSYGRRDDDFPPDDFGGDDIPF